MNKHLSGILLASLACVPVRCAPSPSAAQQQNVLWYTWPAALWEDALPVGNGRLGAMVFGGANDGANNGDLEASPQNAPLRDGSHTHGEDEHIQWNEATLWHGARVDRLNPRAAEGVPKIRALLLASNGTDGAKIGEAEQLADETMIGVPRGMPGYSTLGDLYLRSNFRGDVQNYHRQLDLARGLVRVTYTQGSVHYTREVFAALPDDVIVVRIRADRPGAVSFTAKMDRPADFHTETLGQDTLLLQQGPEHKDAIRFAGMVRVLHNGGALHADASSLTLEHADSATLLMEAATDFNGNGDAVQRCERMLAAAQSRDADAIFQRHLASFQPQFERMDLSLGVDDPTLSGLPTDERIAKVGAGADDLGLQRLYFQFARYLLLSSSRPGGLPANLQGIWAAGIDNPWGSKWTINVNAEMNYWLAEPAALGDTSLALVHLTDMLRNPATGTGTQVAQKYYGAHGFMAHHNTDIWGDAEPIDGYPFGVWPMGGAWLSLQAWEHYAFTLDRAFLRDRAWPVLHDASLFFLEYLVRNGKGQLVTGPSLSPENSYLLPDGSRHSLTMGPTMDIEIVRELFTRTLEAGNELGEEKAFLGEVAKARAELPPFEIGAHGQLQEWQQDYAEAEPGHRHISHLWALYPGTQIHPADTPALAKAAQTTLERRLANGGGQTGWSRAWVVNYWDRLHRGDQAYESLQVMFRQSTFRNLMDTHPPGLFQIDGNLGAATGMLEALVQSTWQPDRSIRLEIFPALPKEWGTGSVRGLRVRGGITLDMAWQKGEVTELTLHASADTVIDFVPPVGCRIGSVLEADRPVSLTGWLLHIQKGETYRIHLQN